MNKIEDLIESIIKKFVGREDTGYKYYSDEDYYEFWVEISEELINNNKFIYDGRRDDAFERTLIRMCSKHPDLSDFMSILVEEMDYYNDDIILIVPLNGLDKSVFPEVMDFNDNNLKTFAVKESTRRIENDKTKIGKYVESELRMSLSMGHSRFKDPEFYNTPVLTYIFRGINDNMINYHSQNIVQTIYAFIRMIEQDRVETDNRWKNKVNKFHASTYAIYYKSDYEKKQIDINNGYGYQFKFFNSPVLDVDSEYFLRNIELFEDLFIQYKNIMMTPKSDVAETEYIAIKRLVTAVRMWNTSYELASIERFDSTLLLLVTILESLLLRNKGVKKKTRLASEVSKYLNEDQKEFIESIYTIRNQLMHEGESVGTINSFRLVEQGHNYLPGYKPFEQYSFWGYPQKVVDIKNLMNLVMRVIKSIILSKQVLIGENSNLNKNGE